VVVNSMVVDHANTKNTLTKNAVHKKVAKIQLKIKSGKKLHRQVENDRISRNANNTNNVNNFNIAKILQKITINIAKNHNKYLIFLKILNIYITPITSFEPKKHHAENHKMKPIVYILKTKYDFHYPIFS
jgi:hypothetical protein